MCFDLPHLSDELPRIVGQRHERKPIGGVSAGEFDAAISYASQISSHGFYINAHGELLPLTGMNIAANASHFD